MNSVKWSTVVPVLAIAIVAAASIEAVDRTWRRLELCETGNAKWIWNTGEIRAPHLVHFTARRAIRIEESIQFARVKIFVDRSYRLSLDGEFVGAGSKEPGDSLDVYDLSTKFPRGRHEFAIEAQSPTGVGGILFALDISGHGRNAIVSDENWDIGGHPPFVWGAPPIYPWSFPPLPSVRSASRAAAQ